METSLHHVKRQRALRIHLLLCGYIAGETDNKSKDRLLVRTAPEDIIQLLIQFIQSLKIMMPIIYQPISFSVQDIHDTQGVPSLDSELIGYFKGDYPEYMKFKLQAYITDKGKIGLRIKAKHYDYYKNCIIIIDVICKETGHRHKSLYKMLSWETNRIEEFADCFHVESINGI